MARGQGHGGEGGGRDPDGVRGCAGSCTARRGREYRDGGGPTTEHLPVGLRQADRLPDPVFTPATKAASGHDENLTEAGARNMVGDDRYEALRDRSIGLYLAATEYAAGRGIMLARHQVRVRGRRRRCDPDRRGLDTGLLAMVAGR